jgi:hypothetical protein
VTAAARKVLADCFLAHFLLEDETDTEILRVHWVGALSLIRAVGHVLEAVDGTDLYCRKISEEMYRSWRDKLNLEHQIFRDFIKHERDLMLKEYSTAVNLDADVRLLVMPDDAAFLVDKNIFRPMDDGPWAGEDARDIYEMAINWWSVQLDTIDRLVTADKSKISN